MTIFDNRLRTVIHFASFYRNDPSECTKPIPVFDLDQAKEVLGYRLLERFNSKRRRTIPPTMASIHDAKGKEVFSVRVRSEAEFREVTPRN